MDLTSLSGVAIARPYVGTSSSTNGESTLQACSGGSVSSGAVLNNVVRNPPTLVSGAVPTGQIGIADNIFPVIQLTEFSSYNEVCYESDCIGVEHGQDNDFHSVLANDIKMDRQFTLELHEWHQLNIDPTSKDIWTIVVGNNVVSCVTGCTHELYYRLFDSSGNAEGDGNNPTDFNQFIESPGYLGFEESPILDLDSSCWNNFISSFCVHPQSNQFQTLDGNGNTASLSSTQQFITVIETENNSSIFTTLDSNGDSSISAGIGTYNDVYVRLDFGGESRFLTFLKAPVDVEPQTFTVQEDTIAVIPLNFEPNELLIDSSLQGGSGHARYIEIWKNSEWNNYLSTQGGETGFIPDRMKQVLQDWGGSARGSVFAGDDLSNYSLVYIPGLDFVGTDEFSIYLKDKDSYDGLVGSPGTITVNVTPVNDPPIVIGLDEGWSSFVGPKHDIICVAGQDWFDGSQNAVPASVECISPDGMLVKNSEGDRWWNDGLFNEVEFIPLDDIVDDIADKGYLFEGYNDNLISISEDTTVQILITGFDVEGDALSFEIVSQPTHGTLVEGTPYPSEEHGHGHPSGHATKSYIYTPDSNYAWTDSYNQLVDSFSYRVNDGTSYSEFVPIGFQSYAGGGFKSDASYMAYPAVETIGIIINPTNDIPVANAGADQSVNPGDIVQLDGSQSYDVDDPITLDLSRFSDLGIGSNDELTYSWIQTAGSPVTLTSSTIPSPQFTAPSQGGQLTFMLTLNDGIATSSPNVVNIYVGESIPEPTTAPPPGSVASSSSNSQVILNWTTPSDDGGVTITDYMVEYMEADGEFWLVYDDGTSTTTSATVSGLTNGQEYQFRISAINSVGIGDASSTTSATPSVAPELPPEEEPEVEIEPEVEPEIIPEEPEMVPEPVMEPEPQMESEATQSSAGCGSGTVLVDGVCELAPTQQSSQGCGPGTVLVDGKCELVQESELKGTSVTMPAFEPLYIIVAAVAVGGAVAAIFVIKKGSGGAKPARQEPRRTLERPTESVETSAFCQGCGAELKPEAKFCGKCGTAR